MADDNVIQIAPDPEPATPEDHQAQMLQFVLPRAAGSAREVKREKVGAVSALKSN